MLLLQAADTLGITPATLPAAGLLDRLAARNGLGGAVYSGSLDRALGVARRVRTGTLNVNGGAAYGPDVPFGGLKESGVGRQNGIAGFDQYLEVKSLAWPKPQG